MAFEFSELNKIKTTIDEAKGAPDADAKLDKVIEALSAVFEHLQNRQRDRDRERSAVRSDYF